MSAGLSNTETAVLKDALKLAEMIYGYCNKEQEFRIVATLLEKIEVEELKQKDIRVGAEINEEPKTR
ncbi:MAG: hypothetical protein CMI54_07225 [Parcubacteria group bacterium]|jgi:hypothetical protein|nr:hypothetical protein [Parcubacteria group bacterium]|tara:strand:+ start:10476 stop:10676 length:201 start_codon:yes stop_codon:yes gene_type:complete